MLTCLWTGGLGGPVGHLCDGVLTAIASLWPSSALLWKIAKPPKWSPSCPLVPFLLFLHACPRSGPDVQMESPGLPVTARCPHSGSSPNCPAPHCPIHSLACPPQDTLCFRPDRPLTSPDLVPLLRVPSVPCSCALFTLKILARP